MKKSYLSSNEQVLNKGNEIILLNAIKNINLKDDNSYSGPIQEITQKEVNNNENSITKNNVYVESNEIDNSGN